MPAVKRGAPLSALDVHIFLAGVLVDPNSIAFEIRDPSNAVANDEDGIAISGRAAIKIGIGHYGAGNTVLPRAATPGTWRIRWTVQKTPSSPILTIEDLFEVVDQTALEDATKETVSRRDIPETSNILALRSAIKDDRADDSKWAFFNSELQGYLEKAIAKHTEAKKTEATANADEIGMALLLAQCSALRALATDRSRFFRWQDGNESVDKSMIPRSLLDVVKSIMDEYQGIRKARAEEKEKGVQQGAPAGYRMEFRRR